MKNNKGFIFIETIITVVVVSTTLILLYVTYSKALTEEKKRLYYDDIAYVFKAEIIRSVLDSTLNKATFKNNYDNIKYSYDGITDEIYGYFFHTDSEIYTDNTLIKEAYNLYNFNTLYYLSYEDIKNVKGCINKTNSSKDQNKCDLTLNIISNIGYANMKNYLKTIDVEETEYANGILIVVFYEMKNGEKITSKTTTLNYKECINEKVYAKYKATSDSDKKKALETYRKDTSVNYNMACEKVYYVSWVYGWSL